MEVIIVAIFIRLEWRFNVIIHARCALIMIAIIIIIAILFQSGWRLFRLILKFTSLLFLNSVRSVPFLPSPQEVLESTQKSLLSPAQARAGLPGESSGLSSLHACFPLPSWGVACGVKGHHRLWSSPSKCQELSDMCFFMKSALCFGKF